MWTARLDYTGSEITEDDHGNGIMGTVDLRPASYNGERRKECARLCNLHSDCGVATYYAASKACTMRTQEATEVSALVPCWTLVKCPTEVVEEKGVCTCDIFCCIVFLGWARSTLESSVSRSQWNQYASQF